MNRIKKFQVLLYILLILSRVNAAQAQRGAHFVEQAHSPSNFMSIFPGYFDTNMVPEENFAIDIPTTALDYGINKNFSLGINGLTSLFTSISWNPYLFLKARYRFYSTKTVSSVITGYGGFFHSPSYGNNLSSNTWLFNGTNNTSYFIDKQNMLNFHLTAFSFTSESGQRTDLKYSRLSIKSLAPAIGYHYFFSGHEWSLETNVLVPIYFNFNYEDQGQQSSIAFKNFSGWPIFYRFLANYKTGESSALTFGFFGITNSSINLLLPWISWAVVL